MKKRPSWEEYFMGMTHQVAKRATCLRRIVGALAVRNKRILASGYNGAPAGLKHCSEVGCLRESANIPSGMRHEMCRGLHAEQNVIIQAAHDGIKLEGATLYITTQPCVICSKMIINAGILGLVYEEFYDDELAIEMLEEAKIKLGIWNRKTKKVNWKRKKRGSKK